jgi:hypothetical protein
LAKFVSVPIYNDVCQGHAERELVLAFTRRDVRPNAYKVDEGAPVAKVEDAYEENIIGVGKHGTGDREQAARLMPLELSTPQKVDRGRHGVEP